MCPGHTVSAKTISQIQVGVTETGAFDREALEGNRGCRQIARTVEVAKRGGVGTEEVLEEAKEFCEALGHAGTQKNRLVTQVAPPQAENAQFIPQTQPKTPGLGRTRRPRL